MRFIYKIFSRIKECFHSGPVFFCLMIVATCIFTLIILVTYAIAEPSVYLRNSSDIEQRSIQFSFIHYDNQGNPLDISLWNTYDERRRLVETLQEMSIVEDAYIEGAVRTPGEDRPEDYKGISCATLSGQMTYLWNCGEHHLYGRNLFTESENNGKQTLVYLSDNWNLSVGDTLKHSMYGKLTVLGVYDCLEKYENNKSDKFFIPMELLMQNQFGFSGGIILFDHVLNTAEVKELNLWFAEKFPYIELSSNNMMWYEYTRSNRLKTMFWLFLIVALAFGIILDYFDEKNETNDAIMRLVGASKAQIAIYAYIGKSIPVLLSVAVTELIFYIVANVIFSSISIAGYNITYYISDYIIVFILITLWMLIASLPYVIKAAFTTEKQFIRNKD